MPERTTLPDDGGDNVGGAGIRLFTVDSDPTAVSAQTLRLALMDRQQDPRALSG